MLLFRSLTVGLLGACVFMLAQLGDHAGAPVIIERSIVRYLPPTASAVSVINVAHGVPASTVLSLLRIGPDERIASVSDREVESDLLAGMVLSETIRAGAQYVDLVVTTPAAPEGSRRVLILLH